MGRSLTVGQIIVLNNVLTEYPMNLSFDTIFNAIYIGDECVTIQKDFEEWNTGELHEFVTNLAKDIDNEIELAMR